MLETINHGFGRIGDPNGHSFADMSFGFDGRMRKKLKKDRMQ
jgi:hypothetical protein